MRLRRKSPPAPVGDSPAAPGAGSLVKRLKGTVVLASARRLLSAPGATTTAAALGAAVGIALGIAVAVAAAYLIVREIHRVDQ